MLEEEDIVGRNSLEGSGRNRILRELVPARDHLQGRAAGKGRAEFLLYLACTDDRYRAVTVDQGTGFGVVITPTELRRRDGKDGGDPTSTDAAEKCLEEVC